jgi:hypothetical protein
MLMTREDMETQLRYLRLKNKLHNRASGAGVVWGLGVSRNGGKVRVEAGYAVDCCGNDLTVTCPYEVDVATLLADPAACPSLGEGPQRMHLLLEYLECPEEPRPVHGDVCSPQTTLCEMSRVRETVRLRLVPPRDWTPDGPIGNFLTTLQNAVQPQGNIFVPAAPRATAAVALVPFGVEMKVSTNDRPDSPPSLENPLRLTPPLAPAAQAEGDTGTGRDNTGFGTVRITLNANPGFTFLAGSPFLVREKVQDPSSAPPVGVRDVSPPTAVTPAISTGSQIAWDFVMPPFFIQRPSVTSASQLPPEQSFVLQNWKMTDAAGNVYEGSTRIDLVARVRQDWLASDWGRSHPNTFTDFSAMLHGIVEPTAVTVTSPSPAGPWPCLTEACDPGGKLRFPMLPPWSHSSPIGGVLPADPKVDLLAATYGVLAEFAGRYKDNAAASTASEVQLVTKVYEAAWQVLFQTAPDAQQRQLTESLHQLLRDWCESLLYTGPTCEGDLHGVVIGCALVKAGDLCEVDPWGGRRWVMHYPLASYWAEQFGVTPPDVLASRFFDFICCIGDHLRTPPPPVPSPDQPQGSLSHLTTSAFNVKGSYLMFGSPQDAQTRFNELKVGVSTAQVQTLGPINFVSRVIEAVNGPSQQADSYVLYNTAAFPNTYFAAAQSGAVGTLEGTPARIVRLIQPVLASPGAVPSLLRDFAVTLSVGLLNAVPLGQVEPNNPTIAPLTAAGVSTAGSLLARDPEALLQQVLKGNQSKELSTLLSAGESVAASVAKAVAGAIHEQQPQGLLTRGDFTKAALVTPFNDSLAKELGAKVVGKDVVAQAVDHAARAAPGANA